MLSLESSVKLIKDSISSMLRVGLLRSELTVTNELVLLGTGSPLDSIAFVTFITDLEERLNRETDRELFLVLTDIHEFNTDSSNLNVATLANYLVKLSQS